MKRVDPDYIIENGIDYKNRVIYFGLGPNKANSTENGTINQESVGFLIRTIHAMSVQNSKKPITLCVMSPGGDAYSAFALYDFIKSTPNKIIFHGFGEIMSSGTIIMAACDEVYLSPKSTVMVHAGFVNIPETTYQDAQLNMAEERRVQDMLETVYAENSRAPKEFWVKVCKRDTFLTAQEAVALGLADGILEYAKKERVRTKRIKTMETVPEGLSVLMQAILERINAPAQVPIKIIKTKIQGKKQTIKGR